MKKLWVGLIVGLLATASPAAAQSAAPAAGSQDPLSLITKGMILPYFGGGAGQSYMEVYSPVSAGTVHMFFFNESCVRTGDSAQIELTTNDVEILRVDNITAATSGLITAAGVDATGFTLSPDNFPPGVHARVLWVTTAGGVRVLEPIALSTVDNDRTVDQTGTWNPMRTGATFFAPLAGGTLATTLYFVCPNTNIQLYEPNGTLGSGAFDPDNGFPVIFPELRLAPGTTPLRLRVYDDEESFLRDVNTTCNCLTTRPVADISTVYSNATDAPQGTYSEVFGFGSVIVKPAVCDLQAIEPLIREGIANPGNDCPLVPPVAPATVSTFQFAELEDAGRENQSFSFTGYRAITAGTVDIFGRLNNGCSDDIAGVPGACAKWDGR